MGFSITSAVFGGIIIVFYSVTLSLITSSDADSYYDDYESYKRYHQGKVVILAFMLFLGMTTFWNWNLGSDMHLFAETLLPATAGKVAITRPK